MVQITYYTRPHCADHLQGNIHWIHCIEKFFTIKDVWATYACPENFHCIECRDPTRGAGRGRQCQRHFSGRGRFWSKEGIANVFLRMNPKLDLGFRFWLRLGLPYVWPGLSRFKRLSWCPIPVSKMSRNFTAVKFSKLTPAWWCIVMKKFCPERLDFALTRGLGGRHFSTVGSGVTNGGQGCAPPPLAS